jgi:[ribosomal protein S18]-alanine N-acetyltransferase
LTPAATAPGTPAVRSARDDDLEALLALEASFPGDRLGRAAFWRFLRSAHAAVWIAEVGGAPVGDAIVVYRRGYGSARLVSLVVAPGWRRRGIGRVLLRHAEREATRRGCLALRLEVRADNLAALALYQGLGYASVGSTDHYYEDGSAAVRMRKLLAPDRTRLGR